MRPTEFLQTVQERIGGDIPRHDDPAAELEPRLLADYKGRFVKLDFLSSTELILEVNAPPPHFLRISPENFASKALDKIGLSAEVKIGVPDFDSRYLIYNVSAERAKQTLTDEFRAILRDLEPFASFEMTHKEYRIFKDVHIDKDYTVDRALADLDRMIRLVKLLTP